MKLQALQKYTPIGKKKYVKKNRKVPIYLTIIFGFLALNSLAQQSESQRVGIGTRSPQSKLEVSHGTDGFSGVRLTNFKNINYLATDANGEIIQGRSPINIYTNDGSLSGNRLVTQGPYRIAFSTSATEGTRNHFSINGSTFSLDAFTRRIGIGTQSPRTKLHIAQGSATIENSLFIDGMDASEQFISTYNLGADMVGYGNTNTNRGFQFISRSTINLPNYLASITAGDVAGAEQAMTGTISNDKNRYINFNIKKDNPAFTDAAMTLRSYGTRDSYADYRLGIGTTNPQNKVEIVSNVANSSGLRLTNLKQKQVLATNANGDIVAADQSLFNANSQLSTGAVPSGETHTIIDPNAFNAGIIIVTARNNCGRNMVASFIYSHNALSFQNGIARDIVAVSSVDPIANNADYGKAVTYHIKFPGVTVCQDGGNGTAFDFSLTIDYKAQGVSIVLKNEGNVSRNYQVSLLRIN